VTGEGGTFLEFLPKKEKGRTGSLVDWFQKPFICVSFSDSSAGAASSNPITSSLRSHTLAS
jgi:hypothetical protein